MVATVAMVAAEVVAVRVAVVVQAVAVVAVQVAVVVQVAGAVAAPVVGRVGPDPEVVVRPRVDAVAPIEVGCADAVPQACKASQAAPWPSPRALARSGQGPVRRVWPEVAGAGLAHQPPDRGCSYRHDPQDQAWRGGVDPRVPRPGGH